MPGCLPERVIGLAQDMLGHNPIGIYGIAKTVVGYGASSLGVKLDVENAGARFLVTLVSIWSTPRSISRWRAGW